MTYMVFSMLFLGILVSGNNAIDDTNVTCPEHCAPESKGLPRACDRDTGECSAGCDRGYWNRTCEELCPCPVGHVCHEVDGSCLGKCSVSSNHNLALIIVCVIVSSQINSRLSVLLIMIMSGTTWMQELLWLVMHDGDFQGANEKPVYLRSPFLEFKDEILNEVGLDLANPMPPPRVIKSHLPVKLMPKQLWQKNCKIVVLFRNPKDLCVSYYHFYRSSSSFGDFRGTWSDFLSMFLTGQVDHGSWFDYTRSWWEQRNHKNVHLVFYEDMQKDITKVIKELCDFLGKGQLDDELIEKIGQHCSFDNMKQNPMTNHEDVYSINANISPLLRKGAVGDWKDHFSVYHNELFDYQYNKYIGDLNIPFEYQK